MAKSPKNQRMAAPKGGYMPAADMPRVIPMNGGKHARVMAGQGKSLHVATSSDEFFAALQAATEFGGVERIVRELTDLAAAHPAAGWDKVLERFEAEVPAEEPAA